MLDFLHQTVVALWSGSGLTVSRRTICGELVELAVAHQEIASTRRMLEILRCKCLRCVAGRRNFCLAISGICLAGALVYVMMTDHGETLPVSSSETSEPLVSDSTLDRPQSATGNSEPLVTAKREPGATKQQESEVVERLPDSPPEQNPSLDLTSLNPATAILDENLAMVYSSHPFGVLPSWLGERESCAPWRPQGGAADEVKNVSGETGSAIANRPVPGETPSSGPAVASSRSDAGRPVLAGASTSGQEKETPDVEVVSPSESIQPPAAQLKAPQSSPASASKPALPPRSETAKNRKRE
jgi:hypothetical protein